MLAGATPDAIADRMEGILEDPEGAARMAGRARAFVELRTWSHACDELEQASHVGRQELCSIQIRLL